MRYFCNEHLSNVTPRGIGCSAGAGILSDSLPQATKDSAKVKEALTRSHLQSQVRSSNNGVLDHLAFV
jgi:hypothetical protein